MTYAINQGLALLWDILDSCRNHGECATYCPGSQLVTQPHSAGRRGSGRQWKEYSDTHLSPLAPNPGGHSRQFNLIPPVCEQAEHHLFQREGGDAAPRALPQDWFAVPSSLPFLGLTITEIPFPHPVLSVLGVGSVTWSLWPVASSLASMMGESQRYLQGHHQGEIWGLGWQEWTEENGLLRNLLGLQGYQWHKDKVQSEDGKKQQAKVMDLLPIASPAGLHCGTACYW